jgi:hypothetical protein
MKKTIFLISFIVIAMISMAQKGSWYLGGIVGYSSSTNKAADSTGTKTIESNWSVNPEFGTFLTNSIQLGFVTGLNGSSGKVGSNKDYNSISFSPTLYVRNFFKITDNFSAFAGIYLSYISGTNKYYSYPNGSEVETKGTHSGFGARLGIGVAFAFSPRFTAVAQYGLAGFSSIAYKNNDGKKTNTVTAFDVGVNTVGTGSVFNIGLYYTFKK